MFCIMPKELEDQMLLRSDEIDGFSVLYNKLIAYSTTKHSMQIANQQRSGGKKDPDAMDVDPLEKKGGKGSGGNSGCFTCGSTSHYARECPKADRKASMQCWVCFGYGHMGKDCTKGVGKGKGKEKKGGKGKGFGGK